MGKALLVGVTYPGPLPPWAWGAAALLLLGALWTSLRAPGGTPRRVVLWGALSMALLPPALIAVAGIYRPAYLKFLMTALPGLTVTLGSMTGPLQVQIRGHRRGTAVASLLARYLTLPLLAALLGVQAQALHHLYADPAYVRDDYRSLAAFIRREGRPGDAVLLNAPPAPYRPSQAEAEHWVEDIVTRHQGGRLFVLFWGDHEADPQGWIEKALASQAFKAGERWVTTIRLARYGAAPLAQRPGVTMEVMFGEDIRLHGYHLPEGPWQPGDILPLTLSWQVSQTPSERLKVFVHLLSAEDALVAQVDMEPQAGTYPTSLWQPGSSIVDRYGIALPPTLPPGTYTLKMGLYRLTGERLSVFAADGTPLGDAMVLRQVQVTTTPSPPP